MLVIRRRTKLVCTVGPATAERVGELVDAGMDVARLNFSHGLPEDRTRAANGVHVAAQAAGRNVAILADLSGPKIRLGELSGGSVELISGSSFTLRSASDRPGGADGAHVTYAGLGNDLQPGDRIFLADGAAELRVTATDGDVETEVVRGGTVRSRAGVNVPSERLSAPALTDRDRADLPRAVELGADYVAQSFVRRGTDVRELRAVLGPQGPLIVAKIETRPAIDDFDAICDVADAVMIARGDLGVEVPYEEVPVLQKQLVRRALDRGVPTIVATQMLESMVDAALPTRAEASDVANAIFDGADAVMLSAETAIGRHPILAAEAMVRICEVCEGDGAAYLPPGAPARADTEAESLGYAATELAGTDGNVAVIACYTRTGRTARILSALRPRVPVLAYSPDPAVVRRLAVLHGVEARPCTPSPDVEGRLGIMARLLGEDATLSAASRAVLVASTAGPGSGPNLLEVRRVGAEQSRSD
jgi:pyruvate kinase